MLVLLRTKHILFIALILIFGAHLHTLEMCTGNNNTEDASKKIIELYKQFLSTELKWDHKEKKSLLLDYVTSVRPALSKLEEMGDKIIEPIVERMIEDWRNEHISYDHEKEIVKLFRRIGTPKAVKVLRDMTLTRNKYWESRRRGIWSEYYFRYLTQKKPLDLQTKLKLKELHLKHGVFSFLFLIDLGVDIPFNQEWRMRLKKWSLSSQYYARIDPIKYLCLDPNEMHVKENMDIVIESIDTVKDLPDANYRKGGPGAGIISDYVYYRTADILSKKANDHAYEYLFSKLNKQRGMTRYCLAVGLAERGDARVKNDLHAFLDNEEYWRFTRMRSRAIGVLGKIGDMSDIPLLLKLAESDPLLIYTFGGPWVETINGKIINNDGPMDWKLSLPGMSSEEVLESRVRSQRQKIYLIRGSAKDAIKKIEKRNLGK